MPTKLNTPDIVKNNTVVESTKSKLNKPKIVINSTESNQNIEPQVNVNTPQMRSVYDTLLKAYDTGTVGFMDKKPVEEKSNTIKFPDEVKIRTSYAGDVVDFEELPTTKKEGVTGNTLLDNTVVPVLYGIGEGAGGGAIAKALNGYDQEELDRRKALAAKQIGGQNTNLVRAGTTTSAVATPIVLTSMGVPAPLAYAETSMLNKAGQTDDLLDWGVAGAKGLTWGAVTNKLSGLNSNLLGKIPATSTNIVANAAKNYLSPFVAATTSNYALGTAEDAYNKARGREVENPTTLKESAKGAVLYAGIQGTKGLLGDIRTSKAQMQADIRNASENVEAYRRQMNKDTEHSTEAFKQKLEANRQEKIDAEIDKLSKNKYLTGKEDLAKAVEALRLGNKPQVEIPKAQLALPGAAGQTIQNNLTKTPNQLTNQEKVNQIMNNKNSDWDLSFDKQVDKYVNGELKTGSPMYLGETPNIYLQLGYKNNPVTLLQSELRSMLTKDNDETSHNHGLTPELVKQLPRAIDNPLNILKSSTEDNSIVIVTDLADSTDKNAKPIIATMKMDENGQVGNIKILENRLTSTYGKREYEDFMDREIAKGNLLYDIDEGIKKELPATGLQSPKGISSQNVSDSNNSVNNIITQSSKNVNSNLQNMEFKQENTEKGSFSLQKNLEKRLNGDRLLDAQDLIKSIKDAGGQVDDNGYVTVYHRTTPENAKSIQTTGKMSAKEDGLFFSTNKNGMNNSNYGNGIVELKIPVEKLVLDDLFDDEASLKLPLKNKNETVDVSKYVQNNTSEPPSPPSPPSNPPTPPSPLNPPEPPEFYDDTEEKIAKLLEERPQREKMTLKEKADDLVTSLVNRGHFVDKLAKVSGNKQLKYKYDRMLSSTNEGNYVVGEKQTNNEGRIIGKSVNEIWKPVEDAGQVQEFSDYLLHKLNIERMSLENVDELVKAEDEFGKFVKENESLAKYSPNTIKQIADGKKTIVDGKLKKVTEDTPANTDTQDLAKKYLELDKQVETLENRKNKPVFGDSVTADDSRAVVAEYEKNYPKFKEWSNDIKTFNKNQLQNMVDAGLTTKETQELLNTMYDNYVRIHRELGGDVPVTNRNGKLKVNSPIKTAKGGNQDILPLKDSMAQQAIEVKKAISRNLFGQELLNTLGNGEEVEDYGEVLEEGKNGQAPTFTVFKDGKPITMKINEELYNAIKPSERFSVEEHVFSKALQKGTRFQKAVLTSKNPIFAFTNFVRDLQTATVNSKDTKKMLDNYRKLAEFKFAEMYSEKTGKPLSPQNQALKDMWELYKANGGESNTYFDFEKGTNVEPKGKVSKALKVLNDKIFGLNEVIEQMPRVAEFITTLENGGTIDEAMYNAADVTVNFKRGGEITKFLDRNGFSFLNASVQGLDKQIRNFTDDGVKGAASFILKCALLGIVPAVANHLLMGDDEDYNDLPNYIKDNYWLLKTGDDTFIRIPRGRDIPTFLGDLATRATRAAQGEKNAFEGLVDTFSNTLAPNNPLDDNIFSPVKAVITNQSWNGSNIVSTSLQNKVPEQQYDAKTTEFAKWIGNKLKVSPKKVDYLLDQYTGGVGDILMPLNTKYAEERGPLSAKFMTDSVKNNKNVSLFYDMKEDLTKKKSSNVATNEEIYELKYLNDANKKVSELYKAMREVEASNLKDKEKREQANKIQKEINSITKEAVNNAEDYGKRAEQHYKNKVNGVK